MMQRTLILLTLLTASAVEAQVPARPDAQQPVGENLQVPPDWQVRLDTPDPAVVVGADAEAADIFFVSMTPGWHITTGPRAIFYHLGSSAAGDYHAEAKIHLFDPGERREAFGLFIGGQDLDGEKPSYDYFVIRNSGEFLLKRRSGAETSDLHPWTAHEAIVTYGPETEGTATNVLGVTVAGDDVSFLVNGQEVARLPRAKVATDGLLGFRVNHHLNLHISTLAVEAR
jgi:hypothetical protein